MQVQMGSGSSSRFLCQPAREAGSALTCPTMSHRHGFDDYEEFSISRGWFWGWDWSGSGLRLGWPPSG